MVILVLFLFALFVYFGFLYLLLNVRNISFVVSAHRYLPKIKVIELGAAAAKGIWL